MWDIAGIDILHIEKLRQIWRGDISKGKFSSWYQTTHPTNNMGVFCFLGNAMGEGQTDGQNCVYLFLGLSFMVHGQAFMLLFSTSKFRFRNPLLLV